MKKIILICLLSIIYSCATIDKLPRPIRKTIDNIELNQIKETEIGEKLVEKGEILINKAIKIDEIPDTKSYEKTNLKKGAILPIQSVYQGYELYSNYGQQKNSMYQYDTSHGVAISIKYGYPYEYTSTIAGGIQKIITKEKIKYTQTTSATFCDDCYKKEIVYNGKSNNTLKFIYREYINDMARPAFNQDLQYDLNESNIIGFKGLRIEVIDATNTNIKYKVLNTFN